MGCRLLFRAPRQQVGDSEPTPLYRLRRIPPTTRRDPAKAFWRRHGIKIFVHALTSDGMYAGAGERTKNVWEMQDGAVCEGTLSSCHRLNRGKYSAIQDSTLEAGDSRGSRFHVTALRQNLHARM